MWVRKLALESTHLFQAQLHYLGALRSGQGSILISVSSSVKRGLSRPLPYRVAGIGDGGTTCSLSLCWGWALQQGRGGRGAGHSAWLEEQPQERFGFPRKPPQGTAVHPVPGCSLALLDLSPQIQGPRAHEARQECSSQLRSWAPKWLLQLSAPALLAGALGTRGISVQALGSFKMAPK